MDPDFEMANELLQRLANDGQCRYIFRHYVKDRPAGKVRLSGEELTRDLLSFFTF